MKALLMALAPKMKGTKSKSEPKGDDEEEAPESGDEGEGADHYKTIAKDAAKDGDWDAMIDALCSYMDNC